MSVTSKQVAALSQGAINTLAQSGTATMLKPELLLMGKGTELTENKALKGRAKRKLITQKMILSLIKVVDQKGKHPDQKQSYWNAYHCQGRVYTSDGRMYGKFCKNRFCTLCSSIRKAEIINKYLPEIEKWKEPFFVTLSVKAVTKKGLNKRLRDVLRAFDLIKDKHRKRNQRGAPLRLMGIKSLECNFNPIAKTYNPHLHLIVPNKETAEILVKEWLALWTSKFTNRKGQHFTPIYNKEKALIEIIKYGSKIFTEPDVNNKSNSTVNRTLYTAALNNIFTAMKGLRIFDRFGFNLPPIHNKTNSEGIITNDYDTWVFSPKNHDWVNRKTEEPLTEYIPHYDLVDLLKNRIDTELE